MSILENFPEHLPREEDSTFRQYVDAHEEELENFGTAIERIKESRQVERSSGNDLDRIGRLFGPVGRRMDRSDSEYRSYLKAVVEGFSGRGIESSMVRALSLSLGEEGTTVEIIENTDSVSYDIRLRNWPNHSTSTVAGVSEIVDPSGVDRDNIIYSFPREHTDVSDSISIVPIETFVEDILSEDAVVIDDNRQPFSEDFTSSDTILVNDDLTEVDETEYVDDTTNTHEIETAEWESNDDPQGHEWGWFEWA